MSASHKASLTLAEPVSSAAIAPRQPQTTPPRYEALQALLAFSALHEQIRRRKAEDKREGIGVEDAWELESFVLDEVLQLVAERALAITGADGIAIALAEGEAIVCRAAAGDIAPDAGARLDPNSGFSGACLMTGRIVRCDDAETDARVNLQACRRLGARSMVAVPLSAKQNVIGLLEAFSSEAYGFNDSDVRSLNLLGELILAALRPEEEDRLAEISRRVVGSGLPAAIAPLPETRDANTAPPPEPEAKSEETSAVQAYPEPAFLAGAEISRSSHPGLAVVIVAVLFAAGLGAGLWWNLRQHRAPASTTQQAASAATQQPTGLAAPSVPQSPSTGADKSGPLSTLSAIQHQSTADTSTVVIDLDDQVQYEAHRLSEPERIYFDLHQTTPAPGLAAKVLEVDDSLLLRIRVAQPAEGVTRVVLDTKGAPDFSVRMESSPYRLIVEIHRVASAAPAGTKLNALAPAQPSTPGHTATQGDSQLAAASRTRGTTASGLPANTPRLRLVLDAGHGGWDLGTVGRKGLLEKDLVLDLVERLGSLVEKRLGVEVIYTRKDNQYIALEKRTEIANLAQADLFLSVHANYSDSTSARGVETYYTNTFSSVRARTPEEGGEDGALKNVNWTNVDIRTKVKESHRFAAVVQQALYSALANKNPGIRNRGVKEAQYVVLTGTSMPAILAEVSFVSSPADERNLQNPSYRQQIAEALFSGIARYTGELQKVKMASTSGKPTGR